MKKLAALFALLVATSVFAAEEIRFVWENPNAPGIVDGYEIKWGTVSSDPKTFTQEQDVPYETPTRAGVLLPAGRYWIAIRAYSLLENPDGGIFRHYSDFSNVLVIKIPEKPVFLKIDL